MPAIKKPTKKPHSLGNGKRLTAKEIKDAEKAAKKRKATKAAAKKKQPTKRS